jgi:uncharacterized membrane protein
MKSRTLRRLISFVKSTLVGGIFFLVPVVALVFVIGQAGAFAYEIVHPLVDWLPVKTVSTVSLAFLIVGLVLVLVCFLAGLVARMAVSQWFVGSLERLILTFIPSYGLMKSMGQGWVGVGGKEPHQPVLVRFDDYQQIGFRMDMLADGRGVIFIPDVPTPWTGSLMLVAADRIEPLPFTTKEAIECLRRLGANTNELLGKGLPPPAAT